MGNNSILATNAALYKKINFDPEKDFIPISLIGTQANILVVNPNVPANSMAELIALAKARPGQAQLRLVRPRRRGASRRRAVQGRSQGRHRPRRLQGRGAGAAGRHRRPRADDVRDRGLGGRPHQERTGARARRDHAEAHGACCRRSPTVDELGIKGFDATTWHGLVAPAGTPKEIIDDAARRDDRRRSNDPARAKAADRSRRRHRRQLAAGVRGLHQGRDPEVDRGGEDLGRAASTDDGRIPDYAPLCAAPDRNPRAPRTPFPPLACDTHAHIFEARFPYAKERIYTPPDSTLGGLHASAEDAGLRARRAGAAERLWRRQRRDAGGARERRAGLPRRRGDATGRLRRGDRQAASCRRARACASTWSTAARTRTRFRPTCCASVAKRIAPFGWHIEMLVQSRRGRRLRAAARHARRAGGARPSRLSQGAAPRPGRRPARLPTCSGCSTAASAGSS